MTITSARISSAILVALLAAPALAQESPVAGEVAEGSLEGKTLTFVSYGGIFQDAQMAALADFVERSGVTLLSDGPTELAKIQAQVEAGNVMWDVVDTGDFMPYVYCGTLFQPLDFSKIDVSNVPEGQVGECSVPAMNYGVVLVYNTATYDDNPPTGWADFFDTENFPGTRAIPGYADPEPYIVELGLLAQGVAQADMFPADIDRGLDPYRAMRDNGELILWTTGAEAQQLMESGEADMLMIWSGRALAAVKNGAEYAPVWDDWIVVMDQLTIPVGVKDPDAAHALINAMLGQRAQEIITEQTSYSPVHLGAQPQVDELTAQWLTNTPERIAQGYLQNKEYWTENYEELTTQWGEFLAGD